MNKPTLLKSKPRKQRQIAELDELKHLALRTANPASLLNPDKISKFADLPISLKTLKGLHDAKFISMTDVQSSSLPLSLCGRDVLAAAKTGSGKTLAFLIPLLERLYRERWCNDDGLGALVLSPTRELAVQIFQVLRKIGIHHAFSAGLIIGGKDLLHEKTRLSRLNILIATPGRLVQHMHETPGFTADQLQMLVLDEADRILDMGFEKDVNAILDFLPTHRQTLLFSATQTKNVADLARLSLQSPEYIAVHDIATTHQLSQAYIVAPLPDKLDLLWSFLKTHLQHKSIVFMSSCKQVRFVFEAFCKLKPGIPLRHLHGGQKQFQRLDVFNEFCRDKQAVLFTTDVAARGLDFPLVNWVLQLDVPDSAETYIHRVGRTARYEAGGNALMFVLPSEETGLLKLLEGKAPSLRRLKVNPAKSQAIKPNLQALCTQFVDLKYLAQRAFVTYVKSVYLQSNKDVFDVHAIPLDDFAEAIGLPGKPKLRFIRKGSSRQKRKSSTATRAEVLADELDKDLEAPASSTQDKGVRTRVERMLKRKNQDVLSAHYSKLIDRSTDDEAVRGGDSSADSDNDGVRRPGASTSTRNTSLLPSDSESEAECIGGRKTKNASRAHIPDESEFSAVLGSCAGPANKGSGAGGQTPRVNKARPPGNTAEEEDDLLTIKRTNHQLDDTIDEIKTVPSAALSHRRALRERVKQRKQLPPAEKTVFDEDGKPIKLYALEDEQSFRARVGDIEHAKTQFLAQQRSLMKVEDRADKVVAKQKLRAKRDKRKEKKRRDMDDDDSASSGSDPGQCRGGKRARGPEVEDEFSQHAMRIASDEALALRLLSGLA